MTQRISEDTRKRIALAWDDFLGEIAAGALVKDALKASGITYGMIRAFLALEPARRVEWDDARLESAHAFMDEALTVARSPTLDASHARTHVDTLKWAARTRNPKQYGDKAQIDVNVKTLDLTRIISEANARLANAPRARVIEHNSGVDAVHAHALLAAPMRTLDELE